MAPELVDETSLLFRLPQRAGLASSQLFVLHNSDDLSFILGGYAVTSASSFGAVAQTHGYRKTML